jgi:xanthine dehydrogenase accessory factor
MICSGEQTILLYQVQVSDKAAIESIIEKLKKNATGVLELSPGRISSSGFVMEKDFIYQYNSQEDWIYKERIGYKNHLYIVGGGHCALALSKIMSMMDFYIQVFDEREGLNTMEQNNSAHERKIIQSYTELKDLIRSGENAYVVVMTFSYRTDDIAVRALINKDFKYFGLLGSKKKIEKIFVDYRKEGFTEEFLKKLHAPVGLPIKSETPEEIAISIAAEIIKVKNVLQ